MNNQLPNYKNQIIINNQIFNHQKGEFDLEERTTRFAKAIIRLCRKLPKTIINDSLIGQIVRSAGSIGANYREANDALGQKDKLCRMKIARKEAKEAHHWLECLAEANDQYETEIIQWFAEVNELKKIFSTIINKLWRKYEMQ